MKTATPVQRYRESCETITIPTPIGEVVIGSEPRRRTHYVGICNEVIMQDCYGVRTLHAEGFVPETIVDLGMHIGCFALHCDSLWPGVRIVGAEVMRDDCGCGPFCNAIVRSLDANIRDRPNISVTRKAVLGFYGDASADVVFSSDFGRKHPHLEDRIRTGMHRWAEAMSVRDFLQEHAIDQIDLLKMDVEGGEVNIFREMAAMDFLQHINVIRGEWHFPCAREEVYTLLEPTHHVTVAWSGPGEEWNMFRAVRRV